MRQGLPLPQCWPQPAAFSQQRQVALTSSREEVAGLRLSQPAALVQQAQRQREAGRQQDAWAAGTLGRQQERRHRAAGWEQQEAGRRMW